MEFKKSENRIWLENEQGQELAFVSFPAEGEQTVLVDHTVVDGSLRGQGVAGKLMEVLVEELQGSQRKAALSCSYAVKWFAQHPEHQDCLVEEK